MTDPFDEAEKRVRQNQGQADPFDEAESRVSPEWAGGQAAAAGATRALSGLPALGWLALPSMTGATKGAESTVLHTADVARRAAGQQPLLDQPGMRAAITPATPGEKLTYGAEQLGEFAIPIPGVSKIGLASKFPWYWRGGAAALREGLDVGIKTLAQTGSPEEATYGAMFAGPVGGAMEVAAPWLARGLNRWAKSQYAKVLHPLGRKAKEVAQENIPDILEQGYRDATAFTREGLASKYQAKVDELGAQIKREYQALDQTTRTRLQPIYSDFRRWWEKEALMSSGTVKDPALDIAAREKLRDMLQSLRFLRTAEPSEVWEYRRYLDKYVYKNGLTADESLAAASQVKDALGNVIRNQLNKQHPSVAALNEKFHMWRAAAELAWRNVDNEVGKQQFLKNTGLIGRSLLGATLGGGGYETHRRAYGDPLGLGPWGTAAAAAVGGLALNSVGWRTVMAVTKNKIANLLMRGEGEAAANLAARAVGITARTSGYKVPPTSGGGTAAAPPAAAGLAGAVGTGPALKAQMRQQAAPGLETPRQGPADRPSSFTPVKRGAAWPPPSAAGQGEYPSWDRTWEWMEDIQRFGGLYGAPPAIIRAVMHNESHGDPNQKGSKGELGLMQLMPDTARRLKVDPRDPQDSVRGAAKLVGDLWRKYGGDARKVLAAYNEGEPAFDRRLDRWGDQVWDHLPDVTTKYIRDALTVMGGR